MRLLFLCAVFSITLLFGCSSEKINNHYHLYLMGESENWYVKDYKVELHPDTLIAGDGMVAWKGEEGLETDSFQIGAHAIINQEDHVIQRTSVSGESIIKEHTTGSIEGGTFLDKDGNPISIEDIENIYVLIEWWDQDQQKNVSERVDIYQKG